MAPEVPFPGKPRVLRLRPLELGPSFADLDLTVLSGAGGLLVTGLPGPQLAESEGGVVELLLLSHARGGHSWGQAV